MTKMTEAYRGRILAAPRANIITANGQNPKPEIMQSPWIATRNLAIEWLGRVADEVGDRYTIGTIETGFFPSSMVEAQDAAAAEALADAD